MSKSPEDMTTAEMLDKLAELGAKLPANVRMEAMVRASFKVNEELTAERNKLRTALLAVEALSATESSPLMGAVNEMARLGLGLP